MIHSGEMCVCMQSCIVTIIEPFDRKNCSKSCTVVGLQTCICKEMAISFAREEEC